MRSGRSLGSRISAGRRWRARPDAAPRPYPVRTAIACSAGQNEVLPWYVAFVGAFGSSGVVRIGIWRRAERGAVVAAYTILTRDAAVVRRFNL